MPNVSLNTSAKWQFWIDRGGTFTDIVARRPEGRMVVHKLLSENPERYEDAPIEGMRVLMGVRADEPLPADRIAAVKMGTTVATNALLERKGDRTLFITTKGFGDALRIGYQNRPDIFARKITLPDMLYEQVIEVHERVTADGEVLHAITADVEAQLMQDLQGAYDQGIRACAISFIHGYRYPAHEQQVAAIARRVGFTQVSASHEVSPLIKWVSRSDTTVVDAYLSPLLRRYVDRIERALTANKESSLDKENKSVPQVLFMQSNGGLTPARFFQGKDSILSGPAGGIVGAVQTSRRAGYDKIITFDMGGTSTDVAHYKQERIEKGARVDSYERAFETEVAGVRLRAPMMAIHTVAAGGGSVLSFDGDRLAVGPESAGAHPGPACYRNGGPLTVTDCNVVVGKIQPQLFPKVFGETGNQPLDDVSVRQKFSELSTEISEATGQSRLPEEIAEGFLEIAVDNMANAIKKISVQKGYDISDYTLCCFGAAGGQHACGIADTLGMGTVLIHPYAGVLSAYGMGLADRSVLKETSVETALAPEFVDSLTQKVGGLAHEATAALEAQGTQDIDVILIRKQLHLRYEGTDSTLAIDISDADVSDIAMLRSRFEQKYQQQYGITSPNKALVVATANVEAVGKIKAIEEKTAAVDSAAAPIPITSVKLFSRGAWRDAPVFQRHTLQPTQRIEGPSIILEATGTNVVEPGWQATVDALGNLLLTRSQPTTLLNQLNIDLKHPDPVRLEIFSNLFQSMAEQMGFTLQNTSSSVNIKERLDFSCALFDRDAQLVANAPHIPVHLGSMGESVQALTSTCSASLNPGDVFISNNPYNGGTHLPDITAITPVFVEGDAAPSFFVASRGHHADIGGMTPGSMPPNSTRLEQEGVLFDNFLLVENGQMKERELRDRLATHQYPARNPDQNVADLQAQIAANNKGAQEIQRMVAQYGLPVVQAYMRHVQHNAEKAIRRAIARLSKQHHPTRFTVPMDCGALITVAITLNADNSATIDFTGTSAQQPSNFNAPLAVCKAAVLYVFRTLVSAPIPLNAGCLSPLDIRVPSHSLLSPTWPAAVVSGNVETSQAITDALYGSLGMLAAAQGTMNNFTFGNSQYQYYETICGGSGAGVDDDGEGFDGTDAVQTHMTNSLLTDPEVLELRFPVLLKAFSIRGGSGGDGQFSGGNGSLRHFVFREKMRASLLSGRRKHRPFGLAGGEAARPGGAAVYFASGRVKHLAATDTVALSAGDEIVIETPGGGGYGNAAKQQSK